MKQTTNLKDREPLKEFQPFCFKKQNSSIPINYFCSGHSHIKGCFKAKKEVIITLLSLVNRILCLAIFILTSSHLQGNWRMKSYFKCDD